MGSAPCCCGKKGFMNNLTVYPGTKTLESMDEAKYYNKWTINKFSKYLTGDILEVGCGIGNFTKYLSKYGKIYAIDIDESLIKILRQGDCSNISVGYGDIESGNSFFTNKIFDTVVCLNVLEHIKDDYKALQNIYHLLKKGGRLILLVPIYKFLYGEIDRSIKHFRRYDPEALQEMLKQIGFTIEKKRKLNWLGALGWFIAGRIIKQRNVEKKNIRIFNLISPLTLRMENIVEPPIGTSILIVAQKNE